MAIYANWIIYLVSKSTQLLILSAFDWPNIDCVANCDLQFVSFKKRDWRVWKGERERLEYIANAIAWLSGLSTVDGYEADGSLVGSS